MGRTLFLGRLIPRPGVILTAVVVLLLSVVWVSCDAGTGACVGTGGVLTSPNCKNGWSSSECSDWNDQSVDGATWSFHSGSSCADLGYPSSP